MWFQADEASIGLVPRPMLPKATTGRTVEQARKAREQAHNADRLAMDQTRKAAVALTGRGISMRDAAAILGISPPARPPAAHARNPARPKGRLTARTAFPEPTAPGRSRTTIYPWVPEKSAPDPGNPRGSGRIAASVSARASSSSPSWCSTRKELWPTRQSATPRGSWLNKRLLGAGQAEQVAGPLGLGRGLAEQDAGLGVGQQPFGQALLLGTLITGGAQVGQAVDDGDVGNPEGPGQLERRLQPAGGGQVAEHGPGLVQDDQALGALPPARAPWSHDRAHTISKPRAGEEYRRERSSTTMPPAMSMPGDVSPSNMPARSPTTRRRNSSATWRPSWRSPSRSVPSAAGLGGLGGQEGLGHSTQGGHRHAPLHGAQGDVGRRPLLGLQGPPERAGQQCAQ